MTLDKKTLYQIDNLKNWMFTAAKNYANSQRKAIHQILGIEENVVPFDPKLDVAENLVSVGEEPRVVNADQYVRKVPDNNDDASADQESSSKWAEDLIGEYISRIRHDYYREVLQAIDLYGMEMKDFAEEQGKKASAIYNDHKHAMSALIAVALSDIRWRMPKLFDSFKDFLTSEEVAVLNDFFNHNEPNDRKGLIKAYVKLLKVSKREEEKEAKAVRREERELRKAEKEKVINKKRINHHE